MNNSYKGEAFISVILLIIIDFMKNIHAQNWKNPKKHVIKKYANVNVKINAQNGEEKKAKNTYMEIVIKRQVGVIGDITSCSCVQTDLLH